MEVRDYSITTDATSMDMSDMFTGVGQITAQIEEDDNTRYLLSRELNIVDFVGVEHIALVRQISSRDGNVSVTAEDTVRRLNVDRWMQTVPQFPSDVPAITGIIETICLEVGIGYDIRYEPTERSEDDVITFPGGRINLWDTVKELAAIHRIDIWVEGQTVVFDNLGSNKVAPKDVLTEGWSADISNIANWVEIIWYEPTVESYWERDLEYYPRGGNEDATILQADAGEVVETELDVEAWVTSVNQPECVEWVDNRTYDDSQGVYSVVGNDSLPIMPAQWLDNGGDLKVELTDDSSIVKVTLTGANLPELAPFRIAMSSGNHYNSLHLTGWSMPWRERTTKVYTGAGSELTSQETGAQIETRHIQDLSKAYDVAYRVARAYSGPNLGLDVDTVDGIEVGSIIPTPEANFRVEQRVMGPLSAQVRTGEASLFEDFNEVWEKVFEDSYTHEWLGTPDDSASLAKYNGVITATNYFHDPKPQIEENWAIHPYTLVNNPHLTKVKDLPTPSNQGIQISGERSNYITDRIVMGMPATFVPSDAPDSLPISLWAYTNFIPGLEGYEWYNEWVAYPVDASGNRIGTSTSTIWSLDRAHVNYPGTIGLAPSLLTGSVNWRSLRQKSDNVAGFGTFLSVGYHPRDVSILKLTVSSLMVTYSLPIPTWFDGDTGDLLPGRSPTFKDFNDEFDGMLYQDFATAPLRRRNGQP